MSRVNYKIAFSVLECDGCGLSMKEEGCRPAYKIRWRAKSEGWKLDKRSHESKDYCPDCVAKQEAEQCQIDA